MCYTVVAKQFADRQGNTRELWYDTEYQKQRIDPVGLFLSQHRNCVDISAIIGQLSEGADRAFFIVSHIARTE